MNFQLGSYIVYHTVYSSTVSDSPRHTSSPLHDSNVGTQGIFSNATFLKCIDLGQIMKRENPLFYRPNQPRFSSLGGFSFFLFNFLKSCEISLFWPKSKKISLKVLENNWKYFLKFFSIRNVPTNRSYLEGLSARKTRVSFFLFGLSDIFKFNCSMFMNIRFC